MKGWIRGLNQIGDCHAALAKTNVMLFLLARLYKGGSLPTAAIPFTNNKSCNSKSNRRLPRCARKDEHDAKSRKDEHDAKPPCSSLRRRFFTNCGNLLHVIGTKSLINSIFKSNRRLPRCACKDERMPNYPARLCEGGSSPTAAISSMLLALRN
jgi:hypothetical protein